MHINETKLQKINKNTKSVCFEFQVHTTASCSWIILHHIIILQIYREVTPQNKRIIKSVL